MVLFISFFTIFVNLYLGFLVIFGNHKSATNRLFALFTIAVALWSLTNYFSLLDGAPAEVLFRIRIVLAAAVSMFTFLYFFAVNFPSVNWRLSFIHSAIVTCFSLSVIVLVFTPLVFQDISMQNGIVIPISNVGMPLYGLNILGLPLLASIILIKKFSSSKGKEKEQLRFLSLGIIITLVLVIITNFLLVNIFKLTTLVVLGPFFTLIFVTFSAYAILRYRLMDIRVILTEALVFFIAFILLIDTFFSQNIYQAILRGSIFLLFFFFAYLLIKSVVNEIRQREELERLTKAKSEFLSIASHQLRTPLTAIKSYASMILENSYGKIPLKTRRPMQNIFISSERLLKLVNDLLNLSRIESGRLEMELSETSMEDLIKGVISELEIKAGEKNLRVNFKKDSQSIPSLVLDKDKIRQVILNIIDNAIRYTESGGITVELVKENNALKIIVTDTGAGIAKEEINSLFESFSRGKAGNKLWTEGTGLGLYVAKKFLEMHQGKIWAESNGKGTGSSFYIELPINPVK